MAPADRSAQWWETGLWGSPDAAGSPLTLRGLELGLGSERRASPL